MSRPVLMLTLLGVACAPLETPRFAGFQEAGYEVSRTTGPGGRDPEHCWGRDTSPAVIETVTDQILIRAAQYNTNGDLIAPAEYRTDTRQRIVVEREETWFRTPCPHETGPDFVASVQRALAARGYFRGPVTGALDMRTRRAIRKYQMEQGLNSGILSLAAAQQLGLVILPRNAPDEG